MDVKLSGYIERATKLKEGEIEFVISTDDWDAYGERILPEGIDFKDYKKSGNKLNLESKISREFKSSRSNLFKKLE